MKIRIKEPMFFSFRLMPFLDIRNLVKNYPKKYAVAKCNKYQLLKSHLQHKQ